MQSSSLVVLLAMAARYTSFKVPRLCTDRKTLKEITHLQMLMVRKSARKGHFTIVRQDSDSQSSALCGYKRPVLMNRRGREETQS